MLTIDELAVIPLFSVLPPDELAKLCRASADIRLGKGEYAVHEGDEAVLLVVLTGTLEVTKHIDGIERVLGTRGPGQLHGEVPLIYGTQFQSGGRAAEPSRLIRIAARDYFAAAAASQELARAVNEKARERIGGLQDLAAKRRAKVTMIGNRWDPACADLREFLTRNQITFDWVALDAADAAARWGGPLPGERSCPVLRLADGPTFFRPQPRQLAERLNLQTNAHLAEYDTIIVGGGPAGLAAAVYGASEGLRTLVVEREAPGGQAGTSARIENYLGFPGGISGDELASRAVRQAKRLGAEILVTRNLVSLDPEAHMITLDGGEALQTRTVIIATGVTWRRLEIDGFDRLIGKGIYYGASRSEAGSTQGQDVHLIGAGNSAGQAAMFFANHARSVTLVVRGDSLGKSMSQYLIEQIRGKSNVHVHLQSEVRTVHGDDHLTAIEILDRTTGAVRREELGGLFVFIGADAETDWLPEEVERDKRGYIKTGADVLKTGQWKEDREPYLLETNVPGIFACGDVRLGSIKRCASAVGEGSMAIAFVHQFLQSHSKAG